MKVLACHNHYQQPGGEDLSFAAETAMLEAHGHEVVRYTVHNDAIDDMSKLDVAWRTLWNPKTSRELGAIIDREQPDVMHCTNTFPLISPAAYSAARRRGVPVVQSLRNYRLLCPGAYLMRDGRVCTDCVGRTFAFSGVRHGCYHDSKAGTAVIASMVAFHRLLRTWRRAVNVFYALTEFSRETFVAGGLPADRLAVKPNFLDPDPGAGDGSGDGLVFVGRLSDEKGIDTLLDAWAQLDARVPLQIVGDGPMADRVKAAADGDERITWLGRRDTPEVLEIVGNARGLILPSLWYECFPRTILESFARGTPVIASRLGSMPELIDDGRTGALFEPGDAAHLARVVADYTVERERLASMRHAARREFETKYTSAINYRHTMTLYDRARGRAPDAGVTIEVDPAVARGAVEVTLEGGRVER